MFRRSPLNLAANRLHALSIRNFRVFFFGLLVSVTGPWMQTTAQAWLVLKLTNSSLALATVASLQFLPIMLFSLIGGAVADSFPRRKLMFFTQAFAALQALGLGVLVITDAVTIWHIYVLAVTLGIINALDNPLRQAFVSELVDVPRLPNAIALVSMVQNMGRIVGPAIGGIALAVFGVGVAFILNAATFIAILLALALIRTGELQAVRVAAKAGIVSQIGESLSYARKTPTIMFVLIATCFIGLFGQNFTTIVPLVSNFLVHASAAEFGLLNSCLGTGSFAAAFLLTSRGSPSVSRIIGSGLCFGLVLIAISLTSNLLVSCALFVIVGASAVTFSASINTSLQIQAPQDMRGRFASMAHLLITGSSPIGAMLTGFVAETMGVWISVFLNGALCCLGMGVALIYLRRVRGEGVFDLGTAPVEPALPAKPAKYPAADAAE
jgi:MFS family permease